MRPHFQPSSGAAARQVANLAGMRKIETAKIAGDRALLCCMVAIHPCTKNRMALDAREGDSSSLERIQAAESESGKTAKRQAKMLRVSFVANRDSGSERPDHSQQRPGRTGSGEATSECA